jgi:predicted metalloendopeptidase
MKIELNCPLRRKRTTWLVREMNIDSFDRNKTLTALEERKEKKKESMKKMNNNLKYF